mgnify:CR=1 FL=1
MPPPDWPATVVVPCGMGDARNLLMALSGDACLVIGGRAGTISEVCLAWLHKRPLLPLVGCGGWSESLPDHPPDERPDGHPKLLHSWPPKLLRAGRINYEPSVVVTRRAAASFNR